MEWGTGTDVREFVETVVSPVVVNVVSCGGGTESSAVVTVVSWVVGDLRGGKGGDLV